MNVDMGDARSGERWDLRVERSAFMLVGVGARIEEERDVRQCDAKSDIESPVESGKSDALDMAVWIVVSYSSRKQWIISKERKRTRY
jgi:hypothetical protein